MAAGPLATRPQRRVNLSTANRGCSPRRSCSFPIQPPRRPKRGKLQNTMSTRMHSDLSGEPELEAHLRESPPSYVVYCTAAHSDLDADIMKRQAFLAFDPHASFGWTLQRHRRTPPPPSMKFGNSVQHPNVLSSRTKRTLCYIHHARLKRARLCLQHRGRRCHDMSWIRKEIVDPAAEFKEPSVHGVCCTFQPNAWICGCIRECDSGRNSIQV